MDVSVCGFNLKYNKKNTEIRELLGLKPVSLSIISKPLQSTALNCQLRAVDCSGLDMLNVKMMQTGSVII